MFKSSKEHYEEILNELRDHSVITEGFDEEEYPDFGSFEDSPSRPYTVEQPIISPPVREAFANFHSAYLYAYQLCEGKAIQVAIIHEGAYLMFLKPNKEVVWM